MNQNSLEMVQFNIRRKTCRRISTLRWCILRVWKQIMSCSIGKPIQYSVISQPVVTPSPATSETESTSDDAMPEIMTTVCQSHLNNDDSDLVALKISLLGDSQIGKTSFLAKYVGEEDRSLQMEGLNMVDKTMVVQGARISFNMWEANGDEEHRELIPVACKDSVAILIMFDLTSRVTLNGVIQWYQEARKWNQIAIPVLVGTKFDEFIQLPIDLQWAIASQARTYAKALNATLFFSSATYNINVNKIFKFIAAKLFDIPWSPARNLTIGEPIIDF